MEPAAVPGAAVWPVNRTWNWVTVPGLTMTAGLVPVDTTGSPETQVAVTVCAPAALRVIANVFVPAPSRMPAGRTAVTSEGPPGEKAAVIAAVGLALATTFQYWSTALTVTVTGDPR